MTRLSIALLGAFQVTLDGVPVTAFRSDKARALLAYLAVNSGQPHRREALATLLWPDCSEEIARNNLRQTLFALRQALADREAPSPFLIVGQHDLQFDAASDHWLDAAIFKDLLVPCPWHKDRQLDVCQFCEGRLTQAAELYRGNFLAGLSLPDSVGFDEWVRFEQEEYHRLALEMLGRLGAWHERRHEYAEAARYARHELALEPWNEAAHRRLMRVLTMSGQRSSALRQYEICRMALADAFGVEPAAETVSLYFTILAQTLPAATPAGQNPYKGLQFFTRADAPYFFGREAFVGRLLGAVQSRPLSAVIGPSGSGKSSVILAGLLPALATPARVTGSGVPVDQPTTDWLVAAFRPSWQPLEALAAALMPLLPDGTAGKGRWSSVGEFARALETGATDLMLLAGEILACHPSGTRLLLVVDQLEEIYTLAGDPKVQHRFLDVLLAPARAQVPTGEIRITLVASLRADFVGEALTYLPFTDALGDGGLMLGPMSRQEMALAIEEPARVHGVLFEPGLIARLLDEVRDAPGVLPFLEFALTLLWDRRPDGVLTHATYDEIGGVQGALAHHAEQFFTGLSVEEQALARRVLVQLVRPGQQTDDTRRVATRLELGPDGWRMAQRMADARLTVTGQEPAGAETVEIAHEALITGWDRLGSWLHEDRSFRVWQDGLRFVAASWEASGRDAGALLRGLPLAEAEWWLESRPADLSEQVRTFVVASRTKQQEDAEAAEAQRQRELVQARALAAAEAKASQRMRFLAGSLAGLFIILGIATLFILFENQQAQVNARRALSAQATAQAAAYQIEAERNTAQAERARAEQQAKLALGRQLAAQADLVIDREPDLGLLLGMEASRLAASEDTTGLFMSLRLSPYMAAMVHGPPKPIYQLGFRRSPASSGAGPALTSGASDGSIRVWDGASGREVGQPMAVNLPPDAGVSVSPGGERAATSQGSEITVWDVTAGQPLRPALKGLGADVHAMAFNQNADTLVAGYKDGTVLKWDLGTGISARVPFTDSGDAVWALSPDGRRLAMTVDPIDPRYAAVRVMDLITGQPVGPPLIGHKAADGIHGLVFSPDGRTVASTSFDKTTILWDVETGKPLHPPLAGHTKQALVSAFSPDGRLLASGGEDDTVILWDVATGQQIGPPLLGHGNWVLSLAFSPDGRRLASGSSDGDIILWDLSTSRRFSEHTAQIRGLAFSPDGRTLASGSYDGTTILYDVATGKPITQTVRAEDHTILNVAFSPRGDRVATASGGGTAMLLDAASLRPVGPPLAGHNGALVGLAFSPDGETLATGSFDKTVRLWDVATGKPRGEPLAGHTNWVLSVAFSPDGRTLASGGADGTIILWDIATGKRLGEPLNGHTNWVTGLAFSPDGALLASGSADNTVRFWSTKTHAPLGEPLTGHIAPVWNLFFDPNDHGGSLISGSADGVIIRWDANTRQPLGPPFHTNVEGETMAISPDGRAMALGDHSGQTSIWQLPRLSWSDEACRIANRNLTPAEWDRYLRNEPYHKTCPDLP